MPTYSAIQLSAGYIMSKDTPTRGFHRLRNEGKIFNKPFFREQVKDVYIPKRIILAKGNAGFRRDFQGPAVLPIKLWADYDHELIDELVTEAVTQARADSLRGSATLLVTLGEAKETIEMLTHPFEKLHKALRKIHLKYKQGVLLHGAHKSYEVARSVWLSYRYGVMPLLADIEAIIKARRFADKPVRATARGKVEQSVENHSVTSAGPFYWNDIYVDNVYSRTTYTARAGILHEFVDNFQHAFGLGLSNIPEALYELTRLSFVVDWGVNLGDYISQVCFPAVINPLAEWVTVGIAHEVSATHTVTVTPPGVLVADPTGAYRMHTVQSKHRVPSEKLPAGLRFRLNMNWKRYVDAVALLPIFLSPFKKAKIK